MDYEKKYKEALERAKQFSEKPLLEDSAGIVEYIFPELTENAENEDEKMRKAIMALIEWSKSYSASGITNNDAKKMLAWLEKQKVVDILNEEEREFADNIDSYRKEVDAAYQKGYNEGVKTTLDQKLKKVSLWKHWKDGIAGGSEGEQIFLIKNGNTYSISSCLGVECDYIELSELDRLLEKQGEQKPTVDTKVFIPKLKVGDWIVYKKNIYQIHNISLKQFYECLRTDGTVHTFDSEYIDSKSHIWNIKDAKEGDVLVASDGSIFLFKCVVDHACKYYIALTNIGTTKLNGGLKHSWEVSTAVHPATKEQRDALIKAMSDAGYTFDFEKKELKKINNRPLLSDFFNAEYERGKADALKCVRWSEKDEHWRQKAIDFMKHPDLIKATPTLVKDTIAWLKSLKDKVQPQLKQEWSEEDERILSGLISSLVRIGANTRTDSTSINYTFPREIDWLKSIKERVQPKQEWSKEDKDYYDAIIAKLEVTQEDAALTDNQMNFLKSLKPRKQWKPSDEQMEYLYKYTEQNNYDGAILTSLYNDLKQL